MFDYTADMASSETTTAILDTAERLFSERGYDAVSIRELTREAGVNVAAIHYHFGSKQEVLRGVTGRVAARLNHRRLELLTELLGLTSTPTIEDVFVAFIRPDIEVLRDLHGRGPTVARFLGRVFLDQTPWIQDMALQQFAPSGTAFHEAVAGAVPGLEAETIMQRLRRVGVVLAHAFATWPQEGMTDDESAGLLDELVAFCAAAMAAPTPVAASP